MQDELTFELHSPITDEEWDLISDTEFEHTNSIVFITKKGNEVEFVKVVRCKDCKFAETKVLFGREICFCHTENNFEQAKYPDHYCGHGIKRENDSLAEVTE